MSEYIVMDIANNVPISHTKVIVPKRRDEILTRPRLLEMMFESLDKKLNLVSAPAGYGKTSLLIDLSHHSELPFCWLSLDALDIDPQRFVAYFIGSLANRFPDFGKQSRETLNNLKSIEQDMERLIVTLVNEVFECIPQHFVLVLDDYHFVSNEPIIQNFVGRFIQLIDENCHLILCSRTLVELPDLPLLIARDQVGGLDLSELAFQPEEIQALLAQNYHLHVSDETAQELADNSEGWITGLQLSGLGMGQGMADRLRVARAAGVNLFDYLGQQVLDQQSQEIRLFLLRSSLLEEFDSILCESVLAPLYPKSQNWQDLIQKILQNNLFTLPVGSESGWVRYHHLFRDFLQARLAQERPEEVDLIFQGLTLAYEARGEWEEAYHIQKRLGDMEALAGLIERAAPHLMARALVTLDTWLNDLPPSILTNRPGILSIRGAIAYMKGDLREGLKLLTLAEAILRQADDLSGLALTLVRRATAYRFLGDYRSAIADVNEVIQLTESNDNLQIIFADALRHKGLSLFEQGHSRQSIHHLERALDAYVHLGETSHIPILMMETGMAYRAIGKEDETKTLYDKALQIWKEEGNLTWQAHVLNGLGVLYHSQGEYEKALLSFEDGLSCARRSKYARTEAGILAGLGDLYADVEDFNLAWQSYQRADEIAKEIEERFLSGYLTLVRAKLLLQQRNSTEAHQLLDKINVTGLKETSLYEYGLFNLFLGRFYLQDANLEQAIVALETAKKSFSDTGKELETVWSQVWLIAANYQAGNYAVAKKITNEISNANQKISYSVLIAIHQAFDWIAGFQSVSECDLIWCTLMEQAKQVGKQLNRKRRQLRRLVRTFQAPPSRLTIQALGRSQVSVNGRLLTMSDWQTQSVRDLFFYFLILPAPATKEQICDVLWPDIEEPSRLKLRFKNEIYRLRRAVDKDAVLFENDLYSFNHGLDYEYDVEAFESVLKQAEVNSNKNFKIELYRKAIDLVHGYFLEDVHSTWVWPERERISQNFLSALVALSDLLKDQGLLQEALSMCQRAIAYEATFEAAYQQSMQIYSQYNNRAGIIRLYQKYQEAMQQDLDLPPSPKMQALYKRLLQ